jgi:hypothetical protein
MSEQVVLKLSDRVARRARETSKRTGRSFETVLIEWLERGAASGDIWPLIPNVEYEIFTPYGNEAAAQVLLDFLKETEASVKKTNGEA